MTSTPYAETYQADASEQRNRRRGLAGRLKRLISIYDPRIWKEKGLWWTAGVLIATAAVVVIGVGIYWSRSPAPFDVQENALAMVGNDKQKLVTGSYTTAAVIRIGETLLDKPGGYLTNDVMPPGVYLDNIPNWEFGALMALRDVAESMRNDLSRSQSQSVADEDLQVAHPQFNYDSNSWILPSTESEYRKGLAAMKSYLNRLSDEKETDAQFYARADNLSDYLGKVSKRLGNFGNRLAYAVGQTTYDTSRVGEPGARQSTPVPEQTQKKTPWLKLDDVFFQARGYTWAVLEILEAMKVDFASVIADKTAGVPLRQVLDQLRDTQEPLRSPVILNGTGFGIFDNHSLVMASYISRANAGIINLRELLQRG